MATSALTAQLPSLAGSLPDLFRRNDGENARTDALAGDTRANADTAVSDERRALHARTPDDGAGTVSRRSVVGPLTYGRRMASAAMPATPPVGLRGANLDVRG